MWVYKDHCGILHRTGEIDQNVPAPIQLCNRFLPEQPGGILNDQGVYSGER